MADQAESLRRLANGGDDSKPAAQTGTKIRGIAVASGKGGVGKTNTVANIAYSLQKQGKRVLVFDADMGLGNIHILLGLAPRYNIQHVMNGERRLEEVILKGPAGIDILPAGSGHRSYSELNGAEMLSLKTELEALEDRYDYVFFDIGAGISANVMYFCSAAREVAVVTSTEPTSFADAYALIKVLARDYDVHDFNLIVNSVAHKGEGALIRDRLEQVADRFGLNVRIELLGHVFFDEGVSRSVREQRLFAERFPNGKAAMCVKEIADRLVTMHAPSGIGWERVFAGQD